MTVDPRHRYIGEDRIERLGLADRESLFATRGCSDFVTCPGKYSRQEAEDWALVVYDENPRHALLKTIVVF
jgi:hypothetical protein